MAYLPYLIIKKNKGRSYFISGLAYFLCIGCVILINYMLFRFGFPGFRFEGVYGAFYIMGFPFIAVLLWAIIKDYRYRHPIEEELE